jgi:hypothetical protein
MGRKLIFRINVLFLSLTLNFILPSISQAQSLERPKGQMVCKDNIDPKTQVKIPHCKYHVVNSLPAIIIDKVTKDVLGGMPLFASGNELEATDTQEISFSHSDPEIFARIKEAILEDDQFDQITARPLVVIRMDIFETTNSFGSDLDAAATVASQVPNLLIPTNAPYSVGIDGNPLNSLSFTTNFISGFAMTEIQKQVILKKSFTQIAVTNLQTYNYSFNQAIYTSFQNNSTVKENDLGIAFAGTVDIAGSELAKGLVLLKNPSITFGAEPGPGVLPQILSFHIPEIYLQNGNSTVLLTSGIEKSIKQSRKGFPEFQRKKLESEQKLVIMLTASSQTLDQFNHGSDSLSVDKADAFLNPNQVAALPRTSSLSLEDILSNFLPLTKRTISGDQMMSFILKSSDLGTPLLTQENYKKYVFIRIKGPKGFEQTAKRPLQSLTLTPFRINSIPINALRNPKISTYPFCISFSEYKKTGDEKSKPVKVFRLEYNMAQNVFLPATEGNCKFK